MKLDFNDILQLIAMVLALFGLILALVSRVL